MDKELSRLLGIDEETVKLIRAIDTLCGLIDQMRQIKQDKLADSLEEIKNELYVKLDKIRGKEIR